MDEKSDPREFRRLYTALVTTADDPSKSYNMDAAKASLAAGKISPHDYGILQGTFNNLKDGNTNPIARQTAMFSASAHRVFEKDPILTMQPEAIENAWMGFHNDLQSKVDAKRKANENPNVLFDPSNKEYVFKPGWQAQFMPGGAGQTMSDAAGKAVTAQRATLPKGRDAVQPGELYVDEKGNTMRKK